jgi:hypothetical protein
MTPFQAAFSAKETTMPYSFTEVSERRAKHRKWNNANKDRVQGYRRKYRYGVSPERMKAQLDAQSSQCLICFDDLTLSTAHVDHDHTTGKVRGLLCKACNLGVGFFKDNAFLMGLAAEYVTQAAEGRFFS